MKQQKDMLRKICLGILGGIAILATLLTMASIIAFSTFQFVQTLRGV